MELGASDAGTGPVVLFFAVPEEARPFVREWNRGGGPRLERSRGPGLAAWTSGGLRVHVTGMGARNAERVGRAVLSEMPSPRVCVTAGFAGGLDPALPNGTIVLDADPGVERLLRLADFGGRPVRLLQASRVAVTVAEKTRLRSETGCDAVEMESSTLRALARERGIPGVTVRVISDAAGDALPLDFNVLMTPEDRLDFGRLAWTLIRSPGLIPRLMAFQKTVLKASAQLAAALVKGLGEQPKGWTTNARRS
ncbi:MAG: hypothetical protein JNL10_12755 [Verrucomicrobiales bacterium]|nr:hypothetical protein [Verrucomicrobiales bacterium]